MKLYNFSYRKENEITKPNMLKFFETEKHIEGIDITKLNEDEQKQFKQIQVKYEEDIKPFVNKAYRRYLKENILVEKYDFANPLVLREIEKILKEKYDS